MPYRANTDLPVSVRNVLPVHAQNIFREAFNAAWRQYDGHEDTAFRVAWAAVKKQYRKSGQQWVSRDES